MRLNVPAYRIATPHVLESEHRTQPYPEPAMVRVQRLLAYCSVTWRASGAISSNTRVSRWPVGGDLDRRRADTQRAGRTHERQRRRGVGTRTRSPGRAAGRPRGRDRSSAATLTSDARWRRAGGVDEKDADRRRVRGSPDENRCVAVVGDVRGAASVVCPGWPGYDWDRHGTPSRCASSRGNRHRREV